MKKGSTEWYNAMAKELNYHVNGMKLLNKAPKIKKARSICKAAQKIAIEFSTSSSPQFDEVERLIAKLDKQMTEIFIDKCSHYLGTKYFWSNYNRPLFFELGGSPLKGGFVPFDEPNKKTNEWQHQSEFKYNFYKEPITTQQS